MRLLFTILTMTILLAPVAASAHGNSMSKKEFHRHVGENSFHCH